METILHNTGARFKRQQASKRITVRPFGDLNLIHQTLALPPMYTSLIAAQSDVVPIRNLDYHVRVWPSDSPDPALPCLVLLHGWMDVGASYQFMVDALSPAFRYGRRIIAPDWRGFGLTPSGGVDHYGFPDYLADLDFLLDHYVGEQAIDLVGHSMGGNIAMLYGGVRPHRVRRLVNLEGFGMPKTQPHEAPKRYARWMDELKALHRGEIDMRPYDSLEGVAQRLMKTNPRLGADKARWLANHWAAAQPLPDGRTEWRILGDAAHKIVNAQLYRVEEVQATWAQIAAPVLAVEASDNSMTQWFQDRYTLNEYHERLRIVPQCQTARIEEAGHMLHHDQPQELAALIEAFLSA